MGHIDAVDLHDTGGSQDGRPDGRPDRPCLAVPFGFVLSMIPNVIGSWFMHGIAIGNQALRLPVAWAVAGAGAAGLPFAIIADTSGLLAMAFAVTGASCALIAHRFTTWD